MINLKDQSGSAVAYMFLALFLTGVLIANMTSESSVTATNLKLRDVKNNLRADLNLIASKINECTLLHPDPVDFDSDGDTDEDDNPNAPYPVYADNSTGAVGEDITDIKCPGSGDTIFSSDKGVFFKLLGDTSKYTTTYYNDNIDGAKVVIDYTVDSSIWDEALTQIDESYPSQIVSIDSTTGSCATGSCLEFVFKAYCDLTALAIGESCGGLIYAGSQNSKRLYTTPSDQASSAWSLAYTTTGATSSDGMANTTLISGLTDTTYPAVDTCTALGSKWFLPAGGELARLRTNRNVGDLAGTFVEGGIYWSSQEGGGNPNVATVKDFVDSPVYGGWAKTVTHRVRCVRSD